MVHMEITGIALNGLQTAQDMLENSTKRITNFATTQSDPAADVVELLSAKEQFQANARLIRVGDQMQKTLLDLLA
jgi:hypothetical protein